MVSSFFAVIKAHLSKIFYILIIKVLYICSFNIELPRETCYTMYRRRGT